MNCALVVAAAATLGSHVTIAQSPTTASRFPSQVHRLPATIDNTQWGSKNISRVESYGLASVAMDCRVGALSASARAVHCLVPKSLWALPK